MYDYAQMTNVEVTNLIMECADEMASNLADLTPQNYSTFLEARQRLNDHIIEIVKSRDNVRMEIKNSVDNAIHQFELNVNNICNKK
jgi:hypothetical protein